MVKGWLRIAAIFSGEIACLATSESSCLPDAVPPGHRRTVVVDGVHQPLGILILDWQSATLNGEIFRLIAEEVLGYETRVTARSATVVAGLWGIAGCEGAVASETQAARDCDLRDGLAVSQTHISLETWDFYLPATLQAMGERYPDRMPIRLGDLGFKGLSANWAPQESVEAAMRDGKYLLYGPSYNDSINDFHRYFDSLDETNTTEFYAGASRCKDYAPMNVDLDARSQLRHFPQDPDAVVGYTDSDGVTKYRFRCDDGVWWLSPACRANRSRCIPYISVAGYGYSVIMHKAVHYNMAIALASTNNWVDVIHKNTVMSYTWIPDATFIDRDLKHILFPPFAKEQHDDHLYTTEFALVETEKWGHRDLEHSAPRVWEAAKRMQIPRSKIQSALVAQQRLGLTGREAACNFLRNERDLWNTWILDVTQCQDGQGLTTINGEQRCEWCPRATYSDVHPTIAGSRICRSCPAGRFQENTQALECLPCPPGSVTAADGQQSCSRCESGKFQASSGMTACTSCPGIRTTRFQGATQLQECVCPRDTYEPLNSTCITETDSCACNICQEGLSCQEGSSMHNWVLHADGLGYPQLKLRFWSSTTDPLQVFDCYSEYRCPGGRPGTCAPNLVGGSCAHCANGFYWDGKHCARCAIAEKSPATFPLIPLLISFILPVILYKRMNDPYHKWGSWFNTMTALVFVMLNHYQTIDILGQTKVPTTDTLSQTYGLWSITNNVLSIFKTSCVGMTATRDIMLVKALAPIVLAAVIAILMVTSQLVARISGWAKIGMQSNRSFNVYFSILFTLFGAMTAMSLELFKCKTNPRPNKALSLVVDASVICFTSEQWMSMLAVAIFSVAVYVVGVGLLLLQAILLARTRFHCPMFRQRWSFLFIRYRLGIWWWGLVFLCKNFLVNFSLVICSSPLFQFMLIQFVVMVYLIFVQMLYPYRSIWANRIEVLACYSIIVNATIMSAFTFQEESSSQRNNLGEVASVVTFVPIVIGSLYAMYLAFYGLQAKCGLGLGRAHEAKLAVDLEKDADRIVDSFLRLALMKETGCIKFLQQLGEYEQMRFQEVDNIICSEIGPGSKERRRSSQISTGEFESERSSRKSIIDVVNFEFGEESAPGGSSWWRKKLDYV